MPSSTLDLWRRQDRHEGDRERLFRAVADRVEATRVLYPGSYVDVAASFVWPDVTYVDVDRRAARFFADRDGVREILAEHVADPDRPRIRFVHGDYTQDLGLPDEDFDLLVSLYAGFVSEHCGRHLRLGGTLLANPSHGDVALASIDPRFRLVGVVRSAGGDYTVSTHDLDGYLVPTRPVEVTRDLVHERGRGIGYTRSPFGYLFQRVR